MTRAILVSLAATALAACSTASTPDENAPTLAKVRSPQVTVDRPTIAKLRTRDRIVSIHAGSDGPRVSLATLDGDVVEKDLSLDDLRTRDPGIYAVITSSLASVDASIDRRYLETPKLRGDL